MSRLTLWGINSYNNLFENIRLPEQADKNLLVDTIMQECGDLYPYYQHPLYLKKNIENWFLGMHGNISKMFITLETEYNPLHNFDRFEIYTDKRQTSESADDTRGASTTTSSTRTAAGTNSGTTTNSATTNSSAESENTAENTKSAFNSATYSPNEKTETNNSDNSTETSSGRVESSENSTENDTENGTVTTSDSYNHSGAGTDDLAHEGHLYGNIGVTTSQQMAEAELELRHYDIYLELAKMFEKRFMVQVY